MSEHRIANRCPKCKGGTFGVTTTIAIDMWRDFEDGVQTFGPTEASLHTDIASYGECRCGHKWRLRHPSLNYIDADASRPQGATHDR